MEYQMKVQCLLLTGLLSFGVNAGNWLVSQTKIAHVQIGNGDLMYMSFDNSIDTSGFNCGTDVVKNWAAIPLDNENPKVKSIISLALSAQAQGIPVDLGGTETCVGSTYPLLTYIRIGKMNYPIK
jgi:hypothetical protein